MVLGVSGQGDVGVRQGVDPEEGPSIGSPITCPVATSQTVITFPSVKATPLSPPRPSDPTVTWVKLGGPAYTAPVGWSVTGSTPRTTPVLWSGSTSVPRGPHEPVK